MFHTNFIKNINHTSASFDVIILLDYYFEGKFTKLVKIL